MPGGLHIVRREQPLLPLIELAAQRFPAQFDAILVDHADGCYACSRRTGIRPSRSVARPQITIHLSLNVSLARIEGIEVPSTLDLAALAEHACRS